MNSKSSLMLMVLEGIAMGPKQFHIYSTAVTTTLSPFSPYASLLMPTMWNFGW